MQFTIHKHVRKPAAVAAGLLAALIIMAGTAPVADASQFYLSRSSGRTASTEWTQIDGTEQGTSQFGNVHVGSLFAYETTRNKGDVWTFIADWDCPPGVLPGGGHGIPEPVESGEPKEPGENECVHLGARWGEGRDMPLMIDRKLTSATLTGQITLYGGGHGGGDAVGRPALNIIWTGAGNLVTQDFTYRYREGDTMYSETYRSSVRQATMSGTMGPMGFDPAYSSGSLSDYKSSSMYRSR